ncbi:MAG: hypothetical protein CMG66_04995 [Candidatus Marinimicrobia bacterium]|nr:hypothetical protein [Candidatus Neomarinimicrobiota bacterium]|tara:strand:+ start:22610 stop:23689 length:1080 start_codon:yes stop_codon:yes gene_type:complete
MYLFALYCLLVFFIGCETSVDDYNPLNFSCLESPGLVLDLTGTCCLPEERDCTNICFGTKQADNCNVCGGNNSSCDIAGCNDPLAQNYDDGSTSNHNCIYDQIDDGWKWVWGDEFNTDILDATKWEHQFGTGTDYGLYLWGNNEDQYYTDTPNNIHFDSCGSDKYCLIIAAQRETYFESEYTSARIRSVGSGIRTYGRVDIRAKLPLSDGTWPAFWMLPEKSVYGGWPASGEIDIMEHIGCDAGTIHGSIHCNNYNHQNENGIQKTGSKDNINIQDFNVYRIDWDAQSIKWYINDILYYQYDNDTTGIDSWPFNQDFYLIINLAIGGVWGTLDGTCPIDYGSFPQSIQIDYVRFFEKID